MNFHAEFVFDLNRQINDDECDVLYTLGNKGLGWRVNDIDYNIGCYVTVEFEPNYIPDSMQVKGIHKLLQKTVDDYRDMGLSPI